MAGYTCSPARAEVHSLGYSEETRILPHLGEDCTGVLIHSHDDSFETAVAWSGAAVQPPYFGAFAESYDLGQVNIECGAFWLTQTGGFVDDTADIYIWSGGITGEPGGVLWMLSDHLFAPPAVWPNLSQHNVEIGHCIDGEFTIGLRPNHGAAAIIFTGMDRDTDSNPWTCIAPGIGYPEGWQHPSVVFGHPQVTMGIGVHATGFTRVQSSTWGAVKALFD